MESKQESLIRNVIFYGGLLIITILYTVNRVCLHIDECLLAYGIISVLSWFGLAISAWFWFTTGRASTVFRWLLALIGGIAYNSSVQFWVRSFYATGDTEAYQYWISTSLWHYREVPILISLVYLIAVIISRLTGDRVAGDRCYSCGRML